MQLAIQMAQINVHTVPTIEYSSNWIQQPTKENVSQNVKVKLLNSNTELSCLMLIMFRQSLQINSLLSHNTNQRAHVNMKMKITALTFLKFQCSVSLAILVVMSVQGLQEIIVKVVRLVPI